MAEQFNVDLPPSFHFRPGSTEEEKDKQIEEYLARFSRATEEMLRRLYNRTKN